MTNQPEQDPSAKQAFAASFLYATEKLHLSEEEAVNFARTEAMRNRFFFEAFRLPHNLSLKLLYLVPKLVFAIFVLMGFLSRTNWWFYAPALVALALWVNSRKWSSFWLPILYWIKPHIKTPVVAENDIDPTDWRSYFFLPHPHGRANIAQMVNACYEEITLFGSRLLVRSILSVHILYLGTFSVLAYFAWR